MSDFDRLMSDSLKGIRKEHLKQIEAEVPIARRRIQEKLSGRRFRFVVGGLAVAAAALAVIVFVTQTLPRIDRSAPIRPAGEPVVISRIDVPGVGAMEAGLDRLWVAHPKGVVGIDPSSSRIEIESPTAVAEEIALGSEAMYTIDPHERILSRIPFGTNEAATAIQIEGTPTAIAASDEAVWVAAAVGPVGDSQIMKFSPALEPDQSWATSSLGSDHVIADMAYEAGGLWISADRPGAGFVVQRIDGSSGLGSSQSLSEEEGSAAQIVVGEGAAWVLRHPTRTGGNTITRVDLDTDDVVESAVSFEDPIESIAVGEGYLWVTTAPTGMDIPDDVRASLHRIDPSTLEEVGAPLEVSGPGSKLAVGYGYVWVGDPNNNQVVQIDPYGKTSPEPEESTPEPTETAPRQEASQCVTSLPFTTSDGSYSLGLGSGGQVNLPLSEQSPQALVHFRRAGEIDFIDVVPGDPVWPPFDEEPIEILGTEGAFHGIEDGFAVTFSLKGCDFQLIAYTAEREVRTFVESLSLRARSGSTHDAFALWPETTPEAAYSTCIETESQLVPHSDPGKTALAFAGKTLGWHRAETRDGLIVNSKEGWEGYHVVRDGSDDAPGVLVMVREVAADCWHVQSVRSFESYVSADEESYLSVDSRQGETTVGFDLERETGGRDVAWVRLIVGPGQLLLTTEEFENLGYIRLTDAPVGAPTYLLVLLLDENRDVVGAIGQPLPSGDFSAG